MATSNICDELDVPRVINAAGTKTRIGGSVIRQEALEAMQAMSGSFVRLSDLQARASERIARITGAESGYVTSGASAALLLGAAAAIAGDDLGVMNRLPNTEGIADEIVMPRTHRTGYDHAFRAAGATIVDVGTNDYHLGTGSSNVELWEIEAAISAQTVAIGYLQKSYTQPPLEEVTALATENNIPVIVDAAAEVPPVTNLSRFIEAGADLVVFSGGKAIRGPQTTGIMAGRHDLIESVALQQLDMHVEDTIWSPPPELINADKLDGIPRQGIGRSTKVGKEELAGVLKALELFAEENHERNELEWRQIAKRIANELATVDGLETRLSDSEDRSVAPEAIVTVHSDQTDCTATELVKSLRKKDPRIFVGADRLHANEFTINPMCLRDDEVEYVLEGFDSLLGSEEST
ncbi:aminotransferase class V-fold PLP-dependent enzyme [Halostagnicola sp. A-GB9-2]|uniref:aminotransferase class V-fold PLP-dependent enzyme n=1 Tax=Halostagnicola sp. A-GB9-2 TaxID=3048066 RepID=UPI0024C05618|nr:aminotransferase class V-fold PLP-dependent enzyme [Halostagnicola sp. A-GB9-2]MDJ1434063.1 aminotransferase class V-fold PLP-dependent enzyme [Halostagnicola sp. A-GB9-2]